MTKTKTSAQLLKFVAGMAQGLEDCGVQVERVEFQGPVGAEAVAVLTVRGNPARYRLVEPDHNEFDARCPHCRRNTIWRFWANVAGQQVYKCSGCGREELYAVPQ